MLRIRLTRTGKKNRPHYRLVVAEHTMPIKGRFLEIVGHFDPLKKILVIKKEEILKWLGKGAKPSNTVAKLLTKEGLKHKSIVVKKFHKKPKLKGKKKEKTAKPQPDSTTDVPESKNKAPAKPEKNQIIESEKKKDANKPDQQKPEAVKGDKPEDKISKKLGDQPKPEDKK